MAQTESRPILPTPTRPESAAVREMFGRITPTYDPLNRLLSAGRDQVWRRTAAHAAVDGLAPCRHVLDVACGTGDLADQLRRAGAPRVTGIDFTRPMLARAARKFAPQALHWAEADALRLPCADGAFDAATIAFGLRNMPDRPACLREMARVVRPGGRVAVLEFSQPRAAPVRMAYNLYFVHVLPFIGRLASGSSAYRYLARSVRAFATREEVTEMMHAAGLHDVRVRVLTLGVACLHIGRKPERKEP